MEGEQAITLCRHVHVGSSVELVPFERSKGIGVIKSSVIKV